MPGPAIGIGAAVASVGVSLGLVWSVISSLRATATTGTGDLLAPAAGYTGALGWSQPAAFVPVTIAILVALLSFLGAFLLRRRRLPAILVAGGGLAIALALALPGSPLRDLLSPAGASAASRLTGPFMPWMVAAFFVWAASLLFLAFASDRHSWALFVYLLMWTFWIPPLVLNNMPSLGITRPPIPQSGEAVDALNSRMADRMKGLGQIPLENGSKVALSAAGAISMAPGMTAGQAGIPQRFPVFDVKGATNTSYLRTGTGDLYRNGAWESFPSTPIPFKAGDDLGELVSASLAKGDLARAIPPGSQPGLALPATGAQRAFQDSLSISPPAGASSLGAGPVPVSSFPTTAAFDGKFDPVSSTITTDRPIERAEWRSEVPAYTEAELQQAALADAPAYTQLPQTVPQRVHDLAEDLTRFEKTPYNKARAIERYLKTNYEYGFAEEAGPGRQAPGGDPVDQFLFEDHKGTCGNFSSAFVVLARSAGIPARTVSGWAISPTEDPQTVRTDQAHQWAEVAFSPLGWVTFDPTPPAGTPGRAGDGESPLPLARALDAQAPESQATPPEIAPVATVAATPAAGVATATPAASRTPSAGGLPPLPVPPPGGLTPSGTTTPTPAKSPTPAPSATPQTTRTPVATPAGTPTGVAGPGRATPVPAPDPVGTFNEVTVIEPPRLRAGDSGTVTGRVLAEDGSIVTGPQVEIFLNKEKANGGLLIGTGTAENGIFRVAVDVPADLPVGKYQVIAHVVANDRYAESWSDPEIEVFAGTQVRLRGPGEAIVGDAAQFSGTITTDGGVPVAGAVMTVRADDRTASVTSGPSGAFSTLVTFTRAGRHELTVDFPGTDLNLPQQASLNVEARDAVALAASWPLALNPGDALELTGSLRLRSGGGPAGRPVRIAIEGTTISEIVTTGSDGTFKWTHVLSEPGRRRLTVSHERTDLLESATFAGDFVVEAAPGQSGPNVMLIAGIAAGLAGGAAAGWAGRTFLRRRIGPVEAPGMHEEAPATGRGVQEAPLVDATAKISVAAPAIATDLPLVWGIGDPLEVVATVTSAEGAPLGARQVGFGAPENEEQSAATGPDGTARGSVVFQGAGEMIVTASTGEAGSRPASAELRLLIVDYRQEVVRIFNDFLDRHRKSAGIAASLTPRGAEAVLVAKALITDQAALDALVTAFEEADYSEHPIARYHYERAYRAWQGLTATSPKPEVAIAPSTSRI